MLGRFGVFAGHIIDVLRVPSRSAMFAAAVMVCTAGFATQTFQAQSAPRNTAGRPDIERFRAQVAAALSDAHAQKANWGILVADAATGRPLYELNADRFFAPASNTKIFTTVLALSALGPEHQFRTTLETTGTLSSDGRLDGDLILVGRGDPDLSNRKFPFTGEWDREGAPERILGELADQAIAKGVKEISGDIVADDTFYPYDPYPEGWTAGDLLFSFGAPVGAILFDDNTVTIDIRAGAHAGDPAILKVEPEAARTGFDSQVMTAPGGGKTDLAVVRQPGPNFILLRGTIPVGASSSHLELSITRPAEIAGRAMKQVLEARGVAVGGTVQELESAAPVVNAAGEPGKPEVRNDSMNRTVVAEHLSPSLLESVRLTNKISHNLHAEIFLREVGREKFGTASTAAGLTIEREFLRQAGVADGDVVLIDGSGLSRQNLATPRAIVAVLRYAQRQSWERILPRRCRLRALTGRLSTGSEKIPAKA